MAPTARPQRKPLVERRRPDPQVIGLAHQLGYGRRAASIEGLLKSVSPARRNELLILLAGGAIS